VHITIRGQIFPLEGLCGGSRYHSWCKALKSSLKFLIKAFYFLSQPWLRPSNPSLEHKTSQMTPITYSKAKGPLHRAYGWWFDNSLMGMG